MSSDSAVHENIEGTVQSILREIGWRLEAAHGIVVAIVESALAEPDPGQALFDQVLHMVGEARSRDWAGEATSFIESPQAQEMFDAAFAFYQEGRHKELFAWAGSHFESRDAPGWFDMMIEWREEARAQRWIDEVVNYLDEIGGPGWLTTGARWVGARAGLDAGEAPTAPADSVADAAPAAVAAPAADAAAPPAAAPVASPPAGPGPGPLDTPTADQGAVLAALDSGRWRRTAPGSDSVEIGAAVGLAELHIRDWITPVGGLTVAGRHALVRWITASS